MLDARWAAPFIELDIQLDKPPVLASRRHELTAGDGIAVVEARAACAPNEVGRTWSGTGEINGIVEVFINP